MLIASQAIPAGKSRGSFEVTPKRYGSYRVVLTDPDSQASAAVEFYAAGWGTSPWAIKNPSRLELDLDKTEYAAGDTATVQVRAPFPGKMLMTVERDKVLDTQIYDLKGNTAKIELPIRAEYRPNAYVTATLVRAVGLWRWARPAGVRGGADLGEPDGESPGTPDHGAGPDAAGARAADHGEDGAERGGDGGGGGRGDPPAHRPEDAGAVRLLLSESRWG